MSNPVISNSYVGDGTTVLYSFTFPYINESDIVVSVDGNVKDSTTEYSFANATTIQFTTAPTSSTAILIKRNTNVSDVAAVFFPGSAVRARDLNDNFTQSLYVVQEGSLNVDEANTTAAQAVVKANEAKAQSQTAENKADTAVSTASSADTKSDSAVASAVTAQASAVAAQTSATAAQTSATAAQAQATLAADVRNAFTVTDSNSDGTFDFVVGDIPIKGNNGVKLPFESTTYAEEGAIRYNNSLDKIELYNGSGQWVTAAGGANISSTPPALPSAGDVWYDHDNGRAYIYYNDGDSNQWVEMNPSWNGYVADNSVTSAKILDGAIVNADVNASAAIAGTKISPNFGSQNIVTTGTASFAGSITSTSTGFSFLANDDASPSGAGAFSYMTRGQVNVNQTANNDVFVGSLNGSTTISLKADGNATFSGAITSDRPTDYASFATREAGALTSVLFSTGEYRLGGSNPLGTSTSNIRLIGSDGSATFNGAISAPNWNVSSAQNNFYLDKGFLAIAKDGTAATSSAIAVYNGAGNNQTISLKANGSATFAGGQIELNADSTIYGGALNVGSGSTVLYGNGQARFAGSVSIGGTAAANTIDDYEEGTWTPAVAGGTVSSASWGRYIKIGKRVDLFFRVTISTMDDDNSSFIVSGTPFTPMSGVNGGFTGSVMTNNISFKDANATSVVTYNAYTTNGIRLYSIENNGVWNSLRRVDVNAPDSIYGTSSFLVA